MSVQRNALTRHATWLGVTIFTIYKVRSSDSAAVSRDRQESVMYDARYPPLDSPFACLPSHPLI